MSLSQRRKTAEFARCPSHAMIMALPHRASSKTQRGAFLLQWNPTRPKDGSLGCMETTLGSCHRAVTVLRGRAGLEF